VAKLSAKIRIRTRGAKIRKLPLDTTSEKLPRGRPTAAPPSEIRGRADSYRWILEQVWGSLWPQLSKAQSQADVIEALQKHANPYDRYFIPIAELMLRILREEKFPKRTAARINFMADSLAGLGQVSPRRSRDICAGQRTIEKGAHKIIHYEFYVECSCGYKGPSRNHACAKCGARIISKWDSVLGQ